MTKSETELINQLAAARSGDQAAFKGLTDPYYRELISHCYRMLGSLQDAEDQVQETLIRAWRNLASFERRGSFRAWLYKIATNSCLDLLKARSRRVLPPALRDASNPQEMLPPVQDPIWLEPFPDELLAPLVTTPEMRYEAHETITLAFMTALQTLPPRQRAVLLLCEVLDWSIGDTADLLETTVSAVNSMLYRARSKLSDQYVRSQEPVQRTELLDEGMQQLLHDYVRAWESADVDGLMALLKDDATFPMPPLPLWYQGRTAIGEFVSSVILAGDARGRWHLQPVGANAQLSFAWYRRDETTGKYQAYAIQVLTVRDGLLSDITTFGYPHLFPFFGLEAELGS
jgi:RNA polymerase sigma-70 factor (ECF subfamily)